MRIGMLATRAGVSLCAAAAALALAAPVQAAVLVFDVTIESRTLELGHLVNLPGQPFVNEQTTTTTAASIHFQQSVAFHPEAFAFTDYVDEFTTQLVGSAVDLAPQFGATPLDAELDGYLGDTFANDLFVYGEMTRNSTAQAGNTFTSDVLALYGYTSHNVFQNGLRELYQASRTFNLFGGPRTDTFTDAAYTLDELLAGVATVPLDYRASAFSGTYRNYGSSSDIAVLTYTGHAVLSRIEADPDGVPEPAGWALMLGGFGLAGGALRRARMRPASGG